MSEEILIALVQLFALASTDDDLTSDSRDVVIRMLQSQLPSEMVQKYLKLYDEYVNKYQQEPGSNKKELNPENVRGICESINKNLLQKQRMIVLLRMLEYIFADGSISHHELRFLTLLSYIFNISEQEFNDAFHFVQSMVEDVPSGFSFLYVSDDKEFDKPGTHFIYEPDAGGYLMFVWFPSVNLFAFRYSGTSKLLLNGQKIIRDRLYLFTHGAAIRFPKGTPLYYSDVQSVFVRQKASHLINFRAEAITYEFRNGNIGLHEIEICESGGRLIGIMGASGSGKSTLLNVLNGNLYPSKGKVTINDIDIHRQGEEIEGVIGYVSQDNLLIEELTVFQNLYFNAKLCFNHLSDDEVIKKVEDLLKSLGLYHIKDLKVGSPLDKVISGGQRKRLNIGLELIREPAILFVDEPTSGLSSRDSENIMDLLKQLSIGGTMVFVVIHQPSSDVFKLFDRIIILDIGGYQIYYGDPVEGVYYFNTKTDAVSSGGECPVCGNINPESIFDIVEQKVVNEYGEFTEERKVLPTEWYAYFQEYKKCRGNNELKDEGEMPESTLHTPGVLRQFGIFIKRDVLSKMSNRQYVLINVLQAPVLAVIVTFFIKYSSWGTDGTFTYKLIYNENLPAYIFMAVVVALFVGMSVSAEEIIRDRPIRKREAFLNLSKGSYIMSKAVLLLVLSAFQTLAFVFIGNLIMEIDGMTMAYWAVVFSTAFFANMLGLNISSAFNSAVTIYILIPFLIIPQLIFSGVIVKFDRLNPNIGSRSHVPFIGEIMTSRWAFEALAVYQFKENKYERNFYDVDKEISELNYRKLYWIPAIENKITVLRNGGLSDEKTKEALALLYNELGEHFNGLGMEPFNKLDLLQPASFSEQVANDLSTFMFNYKQHLNKLYRKAMNRRDNIIYDLQEKLGGSEQLQELKERNTNISLTDLVRNKTEMNKIIEMNGYLIRLDDPIFHDAEHFRAHFYAPRKLFLKSYYDTFWYNIAVIWAMSVLLIITLYYDLLRKAIRLFDRKPEGK